MAPAPGAEGSRHKECTACGEILETEVLEALPAETEADSETDEPTGSETPEVSDAPTDSPSGQSPSDSSGGCSSMIYTDILFVLLIAAGVALPLMRKRRKESR